MDEGADEKSKEFFNKIKQSKKYERFQSKEELTDKIRAALIDCLITSFKTNNLDEEILEDSSYSDVDERAVKSFYNVLTNETIKKLFDWRSNEEILECIVQVKLMIKAFFI